MAILGPHLATGFVINFANLQLSDLSEKAQKQIDHHQNFSMLDILHHLASGVKAFATEAMYSGSDEMRQCCGGAGYLMSSGVA